MVKKILLLIFATTIIFGCKKKDPTGEEKGFKEGKEKTGYYKKFGDALKEGGNEAGKALGEGLSEVIKGGEEGFDKGLGHVPFEISDGIKDKGLEITRISRSVSSVVNLYIIFNKSFKGKFIIKAYDEAGQEVGRSVNEFEGTQDEAKYVDFTFDSRTPFGAVKKYTIDLK